MIIYGIKKNSPLILAKSDIGNFLASDIPAILKYTNEYILLDDNDIVKMNKDEVTIYDSKLNILDKKINIFDGDTNKISKGKYEHFMLKEIFEQPDVLYKTYLENQNLPNLNKYKKIHIVGCGSAYHAGLIGKYYIEKYCNIEVNVEIASEYRYKNNFIDENTLVIFISQSGETADTLACVKKVKDKCDTLGIINVIGSSITREVKNVIYTKAGCEIAVATTKAYSCQILILMMMALKNDIFNLIFKINNLLKNDYEEIAKKIYKSEHLFYIGRNIDYYLALEGSLKLKEISYIHSEAYAAGELKHGTISLIEKNTIVIAIATDKDLVEKTISNIKEVKARGAYVIYITTNILNQESDFYDEKIVIEEDTYQPLLTIIPIQLIAYHVAKLRKCDIDKPKNLAKSVTVE